MMKNSYPSNRIVLRPLLVLCAVHTTAMIYAQGDEIAGAVNILYYHTDHLGSTNVTTNQNGEVVSQAVYYPYGSLRHQHQAKPGSVIDVNYLFSDKEQDKESGLQYFEARYYHSDIGRFISLDNWADNVEVTGAYSYAINNPLKFIDPNGMDPTPAKEDASVREKFDNSVKAIGKHTVEHIPDMVKETHAGAQAAAKARGPAMNGADPNKRNQAGEDFAGDVKGKAIAAGAGRAVDEIQQHAHAVVFGAMVAGYGGLAYALALGDTVLPLPIPPIPLQEGGTSVGFTPQIDLDPISTEEGKEQYIPGLSGQLTFQTGVFSQSVGGGYNPEKGGSFSYGMGVNLSGIKVGSSFSASEEKGVAGSVSLTITP